MDHFKAIYSLPDAKIFKLTPDYKIEEDFKCDNRKLEGFLIKKAKGYSKYLITATYILESKGKIIAYYSLSNDLIKINLSEKREVKSTLRKTIMDNIVLYDIIQIDAFPAVKILRFGVQEKYQSQGIGTALLEAITYSFIDNNKTGCMFITVDAINKPRTLNFYEKNKFSYLTEKDIKEESRTMYRCLLPFIGKR